MQTEKEITAQIRTILNRLRVFHWKQFQGLGQVRGIADIIGIYKGKMLAIEVKTEKGKISEYQQAFLERVNEEGGIGIVARSWWDVIEALGLEGRFK